MINGKRIAAAMPPYSAEKTLEKILREPSRMVNIKIIAGDASVLTGMRRK